MMHRHHDVLELLYIMEGSGAYVVGGHEYLVQPGNLVICNRGIFHGEPPGKMKEMVSGCCVLDNVLLPGRTKNTLTGRRDHPVLYFQEERGTMDFLYRTLHDYHRHQEAYEDVCERLAQTILEITLARLRRRSEVDGKTNRKPNDLIQSITEYLDEHYHEEVSLEQVEKTYHISKSALSHVFKEETGFSPMRYVMLRRIGESQNLLMNTDLPIGDISEQMGFNDNSHFSNTFKKYVGVTPAAYRKYFKAQDASK